MKLTSLTPDGLYIITIQYHPVPTLVFFRDKTDKNLEQAVGCRLVEIMTLSFLYISIAINHLPLVLTIILILTSKSLLIANTNATSDELQTAHDKCHRLDSAGSTKKHNLNVS